MKASSFQGKIKDRRSDLVSEREKEPCGSVSRNIRIQGCFLVVVFKKDAKRQLCFLAGGVDVPASVIVANGLVVDFDHQLADLAAIDPVLFAGFFVMLYPVVALCVFFLILGIRDADDSFAPHGSCLLYRHLESRDEGVLIASEVGVALLDLYDPVQRAAELLELGDGLDQA